MIGMRRRRFGLLTVILYMLFAALFTACSSSGSKHDDNLRLWYDKPAAQWEETLPLGNGRLGMTPDGGVRKERIVLNDITLWSGAPQDANNYDAYKKLPEIRQLLAEGKNDVAQSLMDKDFVCTGHGSGSEPFGCFQTLADLVFEYEYPGQDDQHAEEYLRELDLNTAIARSSFKLGGVTYQREYFTGFDDDVCIVKITADTPGKINARLSVSRAEKASCAVVDNDLILKGQLENGTDGQGMRFYTRIKAGLKGGELLAEDNALRIKNATELTVYVSSKTNFRDQEYIRNADAILSGALKKPYKEQKRNHTQKFRKLFDRVTVDLGGNPEIASLATDRRLANFSAKPASDANFASLMFQFGRYLSICSTRIGLLPPNLQGLWANQIRTPWNGDYHLDINVQMNHWGLGVGNLSELHLPLLDLMKNMVPYGEKTAKAYYDADGWIAHVITNVWGFTEPGESASWGITKCGSGWMCNNLWEHYAYSKDKEYLAEIYPVLKGSAAFYLSILVKDPKTGWLVTSPSSSPENAFYLPDGSGKHASICMGATIDNQIVRELFTNVIEASEALEKDKEFSHSLREALQQIPPVAVIAPDGRIQEWLEDYKEVDPEHRHISHLYGLYPANQITPERTPELAEAAKKTLNVRGDDGPSWAIAHKQLFWARLYDGNRAYQLFTQIMRPTLDTHINYGAGGGVYPNLFSAGPPFQIDGNFGVCAAIGEMLLQSHQGFIHFLPALPDDWKAQGKVEGLGARGNYTVSFEWKDGKVTNYRIVSPDGGKVAVKINGERKEAETVRRRT